MSHLRAFVANQDLSRIRAFLDVLSRLLLRHWGFYSDFVQISAQKIGRWDLWSRVERFVSRYIAKAIYCIIWKHQKISRYLKVSRYFYNIFNAGFWSILAFFWTCKQLQFDNLVVYLHVNFKWFFFAVVFHLQFFCDELTPYFTPSVRHFCRKKNIK